MGQQRVLPRLCTRPGLVHLPAASRLAKSTRGPSFFSTFFPLSFPVPLRSYLFPQITRNRASPVFDRRETRLKESFVVQQFARVLFYTIGRLMFLMEEEVSIAKIFLEFSYSRCLSPRIEIDTFFTPKRTQEFFALSIRNLRISGREEYRKVKEKSSSLVVLELHEGFLSYTRLIG